MSQSHDEIRDAVAARLPGAVTQARAANVLRALSQAGYEVVRRDDSAQPDRGMTDLCMADPPAACHCGQCVQRSRLTNREVAELEMRRTVNLTDPDRRFIERILLRSTAGPDRRYAETIVAKLSTTGGME